MSDQDRYDQILTTTYTRMHHDTCAEAVLQGLLELWGISDKKLTWATAGYMGASQSGCTTCGLLIGASCALGFRFGENVDTIPDDNKLRRKVIQRVENLYTEFLKEFGDTECKHLSKCDFSNDEQVNQYVTTKRWKTSCDKFLKYIMDYCNNFTIAEKI